MNFAKGVMMGALISAGVVFYYNETSKGTRRRMMKQGRKWIKNIF